MADLTGEGAWQQVRRRKQFPQGWRSAFATAPGVAGYQPISQKPTYAQVLQRPAPLRREGSSSSNRTSPTSSRPRSPATPPGTAYYVSPHSPSRLRFPPSSRFNEWRGRCFRCCRTGHTMAQCRNPKRCGRCWRSGHIGINCKRPTVQPAARLEQQAPVKTLGRSEPGFEELLADSYPYETPAMPEGRPKRMHCFIDRQESHFQETERLQRHAVVMHMGGYQWDFSPENAAHYAVKTGLVSKEEIQVGCLTGSRFLITLPMGVDPDTFINATPQEVWDEGFHYQLWSPLDGASISIPEYKILVSLGGIPPFLSNETDVIKAVSKFGVYLGTVEQEHPSHRAHWWAAVGVDDLKYVPEQVAMHAGGMVYDISVTPLKWRKVPLYRAQDLPPTPPLYKFPQPPEGSSTASQPESEDDSETIPLTRQTIREICRGKDPQSLPAEIRHLATPVPPGNVPTRQNNGRPTAKEKGKGVAATQESQCHHATWNRDIVVTENPGPSRIQIPNSTGRNVTMAGHASNKGAGHSSQRLVDPPHIFSEGIGARPPQGIRILSRPTQLEASMPVALAENVSVRLASATVHRSNQITKSYFRSNGPREKTHRWNVWKKGGFRPARVTKLGRHKAGSKKERSPALGSEPERSPTSGDSTNLLIPLALLRKSGKSKRKSGNRAQLASGPPKRQLMSQTVQGNANGVSFNGSMVGQQRQQPTGPIGSSQPPHTFASSPAQTGPSTRQAPNSAAPPTAAVRPPLIPHNSQFEAGSSSRQIPNPAAQPDAAARPQGMTCDLGPDGFYKVNISYDICTDIARLVGVNPQQVLLTVQEDNNERTTRQNTHLRFETNGDEDTESEED